MKCLVTGGAGFIGSHIVDALIERGYEVTVVDNLSTGKKENINEKAIFLERDIRDKNLWGYVRKTDYVFHLASLARIQPSIENPLESNDVNLNGTLNVLEYCRKHRAKLIFSSSSSIYEGSHLPTDEDDEIAPKNPYALQKWVCEQYINLYGELYDMNYTILRYFNVYGERQILDGAYAAVLGIFLDQKKRGVPLTITNDGKQRRDFTYVGDVVRANLMAMQWKRQPYNIGTGFNYSINQIAELVGGEKKYIGNRTGEVGETLASNIQAELAGWTPRTKIEDWINANLD